MVEVKRKAGIYAKSKIGTCALLTLRRVAYLVMGDLFHNLHN